MEKPQYIGKREGVAVNTVLLNGVDCHPWVLSKKWAKEWLTVTLHAWLPIHIPSSTNINTCLNWYWYFVNKLNCQFLAKPLYSLLNPLINNTNAFSIYILKPLFDNIFICILNVFPPSIKRAVKVSHLWLSVPSGALKQPKAKYVATLFSKIFFQKEWSHLFSP